MTPYPKFEFQNTVLRAPADMPDCGELAAHHTSDGKRWISCWRPGLRERLSILVFGRVWVDVHSGFTAPPIALIGSNRYLKGQSTRYFSQDPMLHGIGFRRCRLHLFPERRPTGLKYVVAGDSRRNYRRLVGRLFWRMK